MLDILPIAIEYHINFSFFLGGLHFNQVGNNLAVLMFHRRLRLHVSLQLRGDSGPFLLA